MAADDGSGIQNGSEGFGQELAALTKRVAQLERQLAELSEAPQRQAEFSHAFTPIQHGVPPPPPPPMPVQKVDSPMMPLPVIPARPTLSTPQHQPLPSARSLESRLGSQGFNMIGIVAILAGASYFLKLAIERGWVGPSARVIIGLLAGAGVVLWSESFRRKGYKAFSYSLKAVGSSVLYLSLWASFHLYNQLPANVALLAMILVTAWNGYMAWSQDAELLAAYGLAGGFATPLLLSSGGDHETFLFVYIGAIDLGMVLLMRYKPWRRLLLPAFAATVVFYIGWYSEFFHRGFVRTVDSQTSETGWFVLMFFALFAVLSVVGFRKEPIAKDEIVIPILIPLANAVFLAVALSEMLRDSGVEQESLTWLMVALAALYLVLMRVQATGISRAIHLACAVIFLTIAIPLKASGHTLTTAWLVEGLVLYWIATKFESEAADAEPAAPAKVLWALSLAGYALGLMSLAFHWLWLDTAITFFNRDLGAALVAVGTLGGAAWLALKDGKEDEPVTLPVALVAIDLVAVLLTLREVAVSEFYHATAHPAFANAEFATALVGLAILATISWTAYRLSQRGGPVFGSCTAIAAVTMVVFNLLAILSVEREIGALWTRSEANLQRSLAISAFLMAYGAVLLAAGFWKRSAFVRWQALVLLLFTIAKVFLYDISGLSQGYRVASFMGLGVLLMGISFAYQKDLLGLRGVAAMTDAPASEPGGSEAVTVSAAEVQGGEP